MKRVFKILFKDIYNKSSLIQNSKEIEHRWQTQGPWAESGPPPCFYPAALSSHLTVKEQLHLYSTKITFGPLKATPRLMWPPVKMNLTPLIQSIEEKKVLEKKEIPKRNLVPPLTSVAISICLSTTNSQCSDHRAFQQWTRLRNGHSCTISFKKFDS